jgi:hypothetical protein
VPETKKAMDSKKLMIGGAVLVIAVGAGVGGYMLYKKKKDAEIKPATYTIARDIVLDDDENTNPYYLRSAPRPFSSGSRCTTMNTPSSFRY